MYQQPQRGTTVFIDHPEQPRAFFVELPRALGLKAQKFAKEKGIDGYKLTFHVGKGGGQEVPYLHLHFMSEMTLEE